VTWFRAEKAVEIYKEILETDPEDVNAISQAQSLLIDMERWSDLQDLYLQELDNTADESKRVEVMRSLASLCEDRFGELDDAAGHLQDVLLVSPEDEFAAKDLERILTKLERWQDLVELMESQADRAREVDEVQTELGFLVKIGEIADEHLSDPDRATDIYERVLERDPEHTGALAALAKLYESGDDWDKVAEVLHKAAEAGRGGPDEAEVHYRLARLHENHLNDKDGAIEELKKAVSLFSGHVEANKSLVELCRQTNCPIRQVLWRL